MLLHAQELKNITTCKMLFKQVHGCHYDTKYHLLRCFMDSCPEQAVSNG
jgi:hypothetical protein